MFSLSYFVIYYIYVRRPQNKSINEIVSLEQILLYAVKLALAGRIGYRYGRWVVFLLFEAIETVLARLNGNILEKISFKLTNIPNRTELIANGLLRCRFLLLCCGGAGRWLGNVKGRRKPKTGSMAIKYSLITLIRLEPSEYSSIWVRFFLKRHRDAMHCMAYGEKKFLIRLVVDDVAWSHGDSAPFSIGDYSELITAALTLFSARISFVRFLFFFRSNWQYMRLRRIGAFFSCLDCSVVGLPLLPVENFEK